MTSSTSSSRWEGPELPPLRPTLATTHPELACLGEQINTDNTEIMDKGNRSSTGDAFAALVAQLPDVFNVLDFVTAALAKRGHYDNVAH
jgi:hypothetical protein